MSWRRRQRLPSSPDSSDSESSSPSTTSSSSSIPPTFSRSSRAQYVASAPSAAPRQRRRPYVEILSSSSSSSSGSSSSEEEDSDSSAPTTSTSTSSSTSSTSSSSNSDDEKEDDWRGRSRSRGAVRAPVRRIPRRRNPPKVASRQRRSERRGGLTTDRSSLTNRRGISSSSVRRDLRSHHDLPPVYRDSTNSKLNPKPKLKLIRNQRQDHSSPVVQRPEKRRRFEVQVDRTPGSDSTGLAAIPADVILWKILGILELAVEKRKASGGGWLVQTSLVQKSSSRTRSILSRIPRMKTCSFKAVRGVPLVRPLFGRFRRDPMRQLSFLWRSLRIADCLNPESAVSVIVHLPSLLHLSLSEYLPQNVPKLPNLRSLRIPLTSVWCQSDRIRHIEHLVLFPKRPVPRVRRNARRRHGASSWQRSDRKLKFPDRVLSLKTFTVDGFVDGTPIERLPTSSATLVSLKLACAFSVEIFRIHSFPHLKHLHLEADDDYDGETQEFAPPRQRKRVDWMIRPVCLQSLVMVNFCYCSGFLNHLLGNEGNGHDLLRLNLDNVETRDCLGWVLPRLISFSFRGASRQTYLKYVITTFPEQLEHLSLSNTCESFLTKLPTASNLRSLFLFSIPPRGCGDGFFNVDFNDKLEFYREYVTSADGVSVSLDLSSLCVLDLSYLELNIKTGSLRNLREARISHTVTAGEGWYDSPRVRFSLIRDIALSFFPMVCDYAKSLFPRKVLRLPASLLRPPKLGIDLCRLREVSLSEVRESERHPTQHVITMKEKFWDVVDLGGDGPKVVVIPEKLSRCRFGEIPEYAKLLAFLRRHGHKPWSGAEEVTEYDEDEDFPYG